MKKYNEDYVNFIKLGNYVITLMSAVLRENNQICVKVISRFVMYIAFLYRKKGR